MPKGLAALEFKAHGNHRTASTESFPMFKEAALHLLERSVEFGHCRLSVVRLAMAVHAEALIPAKQWDFCRQAALNSKSSDLQFMFHKVVEAAAGSPEPCHSEHSLARTTFP